MIYLNQTIDWTNEEKEDFVKGLIFVNGRRMVDLKTGKPFTFIRKINSLDEDVKVKLSRFGLGNFLKLTLLHAVNNFFVTDLCFENTFAFHNINLMTLF